MTVNLQEGTRGKVRIPRCLGLAVVLWIGLLLVSVSRAGAPRPNVLVLHSYHKATWSDQILGGLQSVLGVEDGPNYFIEYMDTKKIFTDEYLADLQGIYQRKYHRMHFDVVIAADDNAYQFARRLQHDLLNDAPLVFCGVSGFDPADIVGRPITGVLEIEPYEETLEIAFKLVPSAETVYVLCDGTATAQVNLERFKQIMAADYPDTEYIILQNLTVEEMVQALQSAEESSFILSISWWYDKTGKAILQEEYAEILTQAHRPVFGFSSWQVTRGMIGGKCVSPARQGTAAGQLARQILEGADPQSLAVITDFTDTAVYLFDHELLKRYGISRSQLPVDATILNAPPTVFEVSKRLWQAVWGMAAALLASVFCLILLIYHRQKIHAVVRENEQRYRNLIENTKDWIWEMDADAVLTYNSPQIESVMGYTPQEVLGGRPFDYMTENESRRVQQIFGEHAAAKAPFENFEIIALHKEGHPVILEVSALPVLDRNEELVGYCGINRCITERKRLDETLHRQQAELQSIFKASPVGIGLVKNRNLLRVNDRICEMTGYDREELVGQSARLLYQTQEDYEYVGGEKYRQIQEKGTGTVEVSWRCKNGTLIEVLLSSTPLDVNDLGKGVTFTALDITEQKESEQRLRDNEQFLQTVFDGIRDGISVLDADLNILRVNEWMEEMYAENAPLVGRKCYAVYHGAEKRCEVCPSFRAIQSGEKQVDIVPYELKEGDLKGWIELNAFPLKDADGTVTAVIEHVKDITEQVHAQQQLKDSKAYLESVIRSAPTGITVLKDRVIESVNQQFCDILGYTQDEVVGQSIRLLYESDEAFEQAGREIYSQIREYGVSNYEINFVHKTGRRCVGLIRGMAIDPEDWNQGVTFTVLDITDRKQAEAALRESENKHRLLFTSANDAIFIMNETMFLECNPQAVDVYGCRRADELIGKTPVDFSPEFQEDGRRSDEKAKELLTEVANGTPRRFPWVHRKLNGELFYAEVALSAIELEGRPMVQAIVRDVTERRMAEKARENLLKELRSKNEELESIVYIASHDLRSPLVNIRGFAGELDKSLQQLQTLLTHENLSEPAKEELDYLFKIDIPESVSFIKNSNIKMETLLNGLMKLSRIGAVQVTTIPLRMNPMFEGIVENFGFAIHKNQIDITVGSALPDCCGDPVLINQVFANLIDNAVKYRDPDRILQIQISAKSEDDRVTYCVADNGIGIAEGHISKVFEIFHQLSPQKDQPGEGLGLTIVRRILDRQDGRIWMESQVDVGTKVFVQLPRACSDDCCK